MFESYTFKITAILYLSGRLLKPYRAPYHTIIFSLTHWGLIQSSFYIPGGPKSPLTYIAETTVTMSLRWRHNGCDSVSNHQPRDCLLNRLFRHRSKKTSKLRVTGLCAGNSPETGEFPAQMASNAENVSIWWRHHGPTAPMASPDHNDATLNI